MQDSLFITIIQSHLFWEDAEANRKMFSEKIALIKEETDLIVLPEMFTTGFTMNVLGLAEEEAGKTLLWMQTEAKTNDCAIVGSIIVSENKKYYNRLFFVFPSGEYKTYDKKHTFTLAGEHKVYTSGKKQMKVEYLGWKFCPLICYDLRFPVWSRNTQEYDVLLYVANWPAKRIVAWDALLKARAIENMSYCIGVNRIGEDENGHRYVGHSAAYDILGNLLSTTDFEKDFTQTIRLYKSHIKRNRKHFQFLKDQDSFILE